MSIRSKAQRIASGLTVAAMAATTLFSALPASAAVAVTSPKDVMSREAAAASSTHAVSLTLGAALITGDTIVLTYSSSFGLTGTPAFTCTGGAGTSVTTATTVTTTLTGGCSAGAASWASFSGTNPAAGSYTVTVSGTAATPANAPSGTFALSIIDSDQVTVTATVSPTITFDIDTAPADTETAAPYTVAFGTIAVGTNESSGAGLNSIWLDLDTNATGGAVVTVKNDSDNGLVSLSAGTDYIDSATATQGATANFGLCVLTATATTGAFTEVAPYDGATCAANGLANTVGIVDTTARDIVNTGGNAITAGRVRILANLAVDALTPAHSDYQGVLTFVATGTF